MPPKVSPLKGALKIHQILIGPTGLVKVKDLPTDEIYRVFNCRALRLPVARGRRPVPRIQETEVEQEEESMSEDD